MAKSGRPKKYNDLVQFNLCNKSKKDVEFFLKSDIKC